MSEYYPSFPVLEADDIEIKIKQVTPKGAVALLYKTARTDMNQLDKTVGPTNWRNHYIEIKGNLYCVLEIWDDGKSQWISKTDCGTESRGDGEGNEKKGEASDAFKRAGFRWGIGRELYTAPFTFLQLPVKKNDRGNFELEDKYARFEVANISYDDNRKIIALTIVNEKTKAVVYTMGARARPQVLPMADKPAAKINVVNVEERQKKLQAVAKEFKWGKTDANKQYIDACQSTGCATTMLLNLTDTQFDGVIAKMTESGKSRLESLKE